MVIGRNFCHTKHEIDLQLRSYFSLLNSIAIFTSMESLLQNSVISFLVIYVPLDE